MKPCPYCAELIQDTAAKCRFCGEWLDPTKRPPWSVSGLPLVDVAEALLGERAVSGAQAPSEGPGAARSAVEAALGRGEAAGDRWPIARPPVAVDDGAPLGAQALAHPPSRDPWHAEGIAAGGSSAASTAATMVTRALASEPRRGLGLVRAEEAEAELPAAGEASALPPPPAFARDEAAPEGLPRSVRVERGANGGGLGRAADRERPGDRERPRDHERPRDRERVGDREREAAAAALSEVAADAAESAVQASLRALLRGGPQPIAEPDREPEEHPEPRPLGRAERPNAGRDGLKSRDSGARELAQDRRQGARWGEGSAVEAVARAAESGSSPNRRRPEDSLESAFFGVGGGEGDGEGDGEFGGGSEDSLIGSDPFASQIAPARRALPWGPIIGGASLILLVIAIVLRGGDSEGGDEPVEEAAAAESPESPASSKEPEKPAEAGKPEEPEEPGEPEEPPKPAPRAETPELRATIDEARAAYDKQRLSEAKALVEGALPRSPDHPELLLLQAQLRLEEGDLAASLTAAARCVEIDESAADCWLTLGVLHQNNKDSGAAIKAYETYLALAPEGRYARDATTQLRRLR